MSDEGGAAIDPAAIAAELNPAPDSFRDLLLPDGPSASVGGGGDPAWDPTAGAMPAVGGRAADGSVVVPFDPAAPAVLAAGGPVGTRIRVDPDDAQTVITTLADIVDDALDLAREGWQLGLQVRAAAADAVSRYAAERMREWWAGTEGSFAPRMEEFGRNSNDARLGYQQQLEAYLRADEQGQASFGGLDPEARP